ncbi:hypothetical protein TrRE_jg12862 [Triparma retinervis]|uniref:Uncharacterized protein n=1 Tax=Triparma retinervis TaxID=2557542 RepID=A0A9W7GAF6_9STRA|nr:hypothetical protein TrRE_jg12862 [Triparma retinervis]
MGLSEFSFGVNRSVDGVGVPNDILSPMTPSESNLDLLLDDPVDSSTKKRRVAGVMRKLGEILGLLTFICVIVAIPVLTVFGFRDKNTSDDHIAFYSAGAFVLLTVPISVREIIMHLQHYYMPNVQKFVVRILWMVPLYSVQSWFSLRFHESSLYIESLRDLYESYVLASFLYYIVELLGGEENIKMILSRKDMARFGKHPRLMGKIMDPWDSEDFLLNCKYGVLQYVVLKIFCTFLTIILETCGAYANGSFRLDRGYFYVAFIANFSQCWALYVLVKLYFAVEEDLKGPINWRPIGKFMCIKGVVFFTWWQGVFIAFLQSNGIIHERGSWAADDSLLAHDSYTFMTQALPEAGNFRSAFWNSAVPSEITRDIKSEVFSGKKKRGNKKKRGGIIGEEAVAGRFLHAADVGTM